ncbi:MAG: STAS domain-containing protein [Candidatus Acidiferrales bacterium]
MNISTRQSGHATVVDINGDVTLYNSPEIRKTLMDALNKKGTNRVVMNMSGVNYIDSAGVASLVEGLKLARTLKSGFALYGLNKHPREVLELTRLIKVFEIYDNETEAVNGIAAAPPAPETK